MIKELILIIFLTAIDCIELVFDICLEFLKLLISSIVELVMFCAELLIIFCMSMIDMVYYVWHLVKIDIVTFSRKYTDIEDFHDAFTRVFTLIVSTRSKYWHRDINK